MPRYAARSCPPPQDRPCRKLCPFRQKGARRLSDLRARSPAFNGCMSGVQSASRFNGRDGVIGNRKANHQTVFSSHIIFQSWFENDR